MTAPYPDVDLTIIGGGIAGLWTLAEARANGIRAILLEKNQLGCGQTLASQGIIHGGAKYSLQGSISKATTAIQAMPARWQQAYQGEGPVDLSKARVLASTQYLIPSKGIDSQLITFLGSKVMASHSRRIKARDLPQAYQDCGIDQNLFALNETVFDVQSVIRCLYEFHKEAIYQGQLTDNQITPLEKQDGYQLTLSPECTITSRFLLWTNGNGAADVAITQNKLQQRPLHMVMIRGHLPYVYAHWIGRTNKPLLTVTSHPAGNKKPEQTIWYLGGQLAEEGVQRTEQAQHAHTKQLINHLLPSIATHSLAISSYHVNRAEAKQDQQQRPDGAFVRRHGNILFGWPTKLALAPQFASKALALLPQNVTRQPTNNPKSLPENLTPILPLAKPAIGSMPWDCME